MHEALRELGISYILDPRSKSLQVSSSSSSPSSLPPIISARIVEEEEAPKVELSSQLATTPTDMGNNQETDQVVEEAMASCVGEKSDDIQPPVEEKDEDYDVPVADYTSKPRHLENVFPSLGPSPDAYRHRKEVTEKVTESEEEKKEDEKQEELHADDNNTVELWEGSVDDVPVIQNEKKDDDDEEEEEEDEVESSTLKEKDKGCDAPVAFATDLYSDAGLQAITMRAVDATTATTIKDEEDDDDEEEEFLVKDAMIESLSRPSSSLSLLSALSWRRIAVSVLVHLVSALLVFVIAAALSLSMYM